MTTSNLVWIIADKDGYGFETPDGDAYGAPSLDEAITLAVSLGFEYKIEA